MSHPMPAPSVPTPSVQISPRSVSVAQGAVLAYQVAVGSGGGGGGTSCSSEGSEALVEAGMVVVLMRVAATKSTLLSDPTGEKTN